MSATNFPEYAQRVSHILNTLVATGEAVLTSLQVDQRSALRGFIIASLQFDDGSTLEVREFVDVRQTEPKIMYAYHIRHCTDTSIDEFHSDRDSNLQICISRR